MMTVMVAYAPSNVCQQELTVELKPHSNVAMAIRRSGILEQFPDIPFPDIQVGIYSRAVNLDTEVHDGDRIEIYRPLLIDPKEARLLRAQKNKLKNKQKSRK